MGPRRVFIAKTYLLAVLAAITAGAATSAEIVTAEPGSAPDCGSLWRHPVTAPIVDTYRPPSNPFGSGNRGLEYGTASGDPVVAVAAGVVEFAGQVGGTRFVVVEHEPGLWSTYAYLQTFGVAVGDEVTPGQLLAAAETGFHLTARRSLAAGGGRSYVDPSPLLASECFVVKLVPIPAPELMIPIDIN